MKKMLAEEPTDEKEMHDRSGLWLILKLFHYLGFRVLADPSKESCLHRCYVRSLLVVICVTFSISSYLMSFIFIRSDGSVDWESLGLYAFVGFGYAGMLINYTLALTKAKNVSVLVRSLTSALMGISNPEQKRKIVRRIKRNIFLYCVPTIVFGTVSTFAAFFVGQMRINQVNEETIATPYIIAICWISSSLWFISIGAFYLLYTAFILIVCDVINQVIDVYVESKADDVIKDLWVNPSRWDLIREEEMSRIMTNHKKMSLIVGEANSVFAQFLLVSLAMEITICIGYVKLITMKDGALSFGAYTNSLNVVYLILKAFACSNVNDKLKSSILLKKLPNSSFLSNDPVSCFILYQNEQQIGRAQFTYGEIFPVKKTFIFTIAGTALTYALVLQGIGQSS